MPRSANRRNTVLSFFFALVALVLLPRAAVAQAPGVRGGISVDPDQFFVGGHYETTALVDRLHFRPNVELGFGDDLTLLGVNFEVIYKLPLDTAPWTLYAGGGPALNVYWFEDIDSDNEAGFNGFFGAESERGLFFEVKVGAEGSPRLKFMVGWNLR
jgi:hypothetical protein